MLNRPLIQKRAIRGIAASICVSAMLTGCQLLPQEEVFSQAPVIESYEVKEYKQTIVQRGDLFLKDNVTCKYMPAKKAVLSFPIGGEYIENIYVQEGQQVKAGELLAQIELGDLEEQISSVLHEMKVLQVKNEHIKEDLELEQRMNEVLYEEGTEQYQAHKAVTAENHRLMLEDNNDALYLLQMQYQDLLEEKAMRQIYAEFDGTVTFAQIMTDGLVSSKDKNVVTVSDMNTTAFTVEGNDAAYFPVGTEVTITMGNKTFYATSVEMSALGLEESSQKKEKAVAYLMLSEPDPTLESGDNGKIEVVLDSRTDVMYLDKDAIKTANGRQFVYMLDDDGLRIMQDVTVGLQVDKMIEITSGLKEGDSVLLD